MIAWNVAGRLVAAIAMALDLVVIGGAVAASLPDPAEKPILIVQGKIAVTNKDGVAQFDRAMLEAIGMVTVETTTPWHQGTVKFEGVPLAALMQKVAASGDRVVAIALNDYSAEIPIEDFAKYGTILALKRDGEYMPVRDKGPLFIVYPYDSNPDLKSKQFYGRSVWQVARLEIK